MSAEQKWTPEHQALVELGDALIAIRRERDQLAKVLRYLVRLIDDAHLGPVNDGRAMTEEIVGQVESARAALARLHL